MTLVSGDIMFMQIFAGVFWRGGIKQWGNRKRRFSGLLNYMKAAMVLVHLYLLLCNSFRKPRKVFKTSVNAHLQCLQHLWKWGQHYYIVLFSPLLPFKWPQNIWPWMTWTGYLALNSVYALVSLAETAQLRKIIEWRLIKIDTYCQQCKSSAGTLVSGYIRFVRIFGRVL